jgi:hypothetical protein
MSQTYHILIQSNKRPEKNITMYSSSLDLLQRKLSWYMKNEGYLVAHIWNEKGEKVVNRMRVSNSTIKY